MKSSFKKLLMIFVILVVAMAIIPATVGAADTAKVSGWNIALGDNICVNFYLAVPETDVDNTQVSITVEGKTISSAVSALELSGEEYVCSIGLPAAQMTENIQVVLTTGDTEVVNNSYTVYQYASYILQENYAQEMKDLVAHMLNYGATAQSYFGWNTDNLANDGVDVDLRAVPASMSMTSSGSIAGLDFVGCSMIHLNRIGVRFYYEQDISGYDIDISTDAAYTTGSNTSGYYVQILGINPQDYSNDITVTVTSGSESASWTYSPMHYITRMYHKSSSTAEKNMMQALYNYHIAALNYLGEVQTATVYDIYDLTGETEKSVDAWGDPAPVLGNVATEDKEQAAVTFKMDITDERHRYRLSLGAQEADACVDPMGYGLEIAVNFDGSNYVQFLRNNSQIAIFDDVSGLIGENKKYEFGYRNITLNGQIVGKQVYLSVDGVDLYTYDDYNGYLTGDAVGTKVAFHHIDNNAALLNTTYTIETVAAEVYDVYDLTGKSKVSVSGWATTELGNISEDHKEQAAISVGLNIKEDRDRYFFAVGAPAGEDCSNPQGYGVQITSNVDGQSYVIFYRNGTGIKNFGDVSALVGYHSVEFGYRTINITSALTTKTTTLYKQVYLNVDGAELYTCNDKEFLTGDAINTTVAAYHIDEVAYLKMSDTYLGTEKVYDVSELNGRPINTVSGGGLGVLNATIFGNVAVADKENVSVKADVTIDNADVEYRFSLGALDSDGCVDAAGYGLVLRFDMNRLVFTRKGEGIASWEITNADWQGAYELEFGYRDVLGDGEVVGKYIFVKKNGEELYTYKDLNGYLTGDTLGTKVGLFHYDDYAYVDTTYDITTTYGTAKVYDLYDLTGARTKTINGRVQTGTWDQQLGTVAEADKGNVAFTSKVTVGSAYEHIFIGVGMTGANASGTSDGYIFEIQAKAGEPDAVVYHKKNASWQGSSQGLTFDFNGTYVLEVGVVDIIMNNVVVGKRAYVKADGNLICYYDDIRTPVTTENLSTVVGIYNEQNNITMESTYDFSCNTEKVYDIYDLTGATENTINGTSNGASWDEGQLLGNFNVADKENVSLKADVTIGSANEYRFSLGALDGDACVDVAGYGLVLHFGMNKLIFARQGSWIVSWDITASDWQGEYELEFGYRDITLDGNVIGKELFVKKDGETVYTFDDMSGYLTGSTLGTKVALFHYDTTVQMDTTYATTYGEVNIYNITTNDIYGTTGSSVGGGDNWTGTAFGNVDSANKENVAWNAYVTFAEQKEYRFAIGAQESSSYTDASGYRVYVYLGDATTDIKNTIAIVRGNEWIASWDVDISGLENQTLPVELGYRDIMINGNVIGKQIYVTIQGVGTYSYDDCSGYLTGDALGTIAALFHYGSKVTITPIS